MMTKYYTHIPSNQTCHKTRLFGQDYLVFESTREMKAMTKEGIYSDYTLKDYYEN